MCVLIISLLQYFRLESTIKLISSTRTMSFSSNSHSEMCSAMQRVLWTASAPQIHAKVSSNHIFLARFHENQTRHFSSTITICARRKQRFNSFPSQAQKGSASSTRYAAILLFE